MPDLVWEGKHDDAGQRLAPFQVALPFRTVETVDGSAQDRRGSPDLFGEGQETDWLNRLTWDDKKYVLPFLLPEFAEAVDLIYIDPPFFTGDDYSFTIAVEGEAFTRNPNLV